MLEVDVDVGRLVAFLADEAFEEDVDAVGIDVGYVQDVADGRVGRTAASLAEDPPRAGEAHEVPYREEVRFVGQLFDELELMLQEAADFAWYAVGEVAAGALPGELGEVLSGGLIGRAELFGIFVAEFVEAEGAAVGDFDGSRDGVGMCGEQSGHLLGRFEVALAVGKEALAGVGDGALLANAGEDVLEEAALGDVIVNVVGGDHGHAGPSG